MKENTIHIKLEYEEAREAKKDFLSSQMNLLRIAKKIKEYQTLRREELNLKLKLSKNIKETKTSIGKIQRSLPILKIPEILKKHDEDIEIDEIESKIKTPRKEQHSENIEYELQEIQKKLDALQR